LPSVVEAVTSPRLLTMRTSYLRASHHDTFWRSISVGE